MGDNDDTVEAVPDVVRADTTAIGDSALSLVLMVVLVLLPNVLTIVLDDLHLFKLLLRCCFITSVMLFLFVNLDEENLEDAEGEVGCNNGFCCTGTGTEAGALEPLAAVVDFTVLVLLVLLVIALGFETEFVMVLLDCTGFAVTTLFVGGKISFGLTLLVLLPTGVPKLLAFFSSILVLESTGL